MIDLHNHILPSWDDGPTSLAETFAMARQAVSVGTTVMVATPHRTAYGKKTRADLVRSRVHQLNIELAEQGIPLEVLPGVEIPISDTMADEIESRELLTIADGKYILAEPPFPNLPATLLESLETTIGRGHSIVLAHPERNSVVQKQWTELQQLDFVTACAGLGCVIQLTSGSILGRFGRTAAEVSRAIVSHSDWDIVIASDSHDQKDRTPQLLRQAMETVAEWAGDEAVARCMVEDLPRLIIGR